MRPQVPQVRGVLSYDASLGQPLRGVPIREEPLWLLSTEEEVVSVTVSLYVNGFEFQHKGAEHAFSFVPFIMVRNCKFQAITSQGVNLAEFRCFKVSMFTHGVCLYFGVHEKKFDAGVAEEKRAAWVLDISRAVRLVTQSLYPSFQICCRPLASVPKTSRRILAGYLAHHDDSNTISVLYCELQPQQGDKGRLVMYDNESCQECLSEIILTPRTTCTEKVGISCTCFTVEQHLFSARTIAERKLWLRALSNIKVKLQHGAPEPDEEALRHYRVAILEHARTTGCNDTQAVMDALLRRHVKHIQFPEMPFGYSQDGFFAMPMQPDVQVPSHDLPAVAPPLKQPDMAGAGDAPLDLESDSPTSNRSRGGSNAL